MQTVLTIEIDDAGSPRLQKNRKREMRRIMRIIADQIQWGDRTRPITDRDDVTVGAWRLAEVQ